VDKITNPDLALDSEILDEFGYSRCLNDFIDLPDMVGSFVSGVTASLVAKKMNKNNYSSVLN